MMTGGTNLLVLTISALGHLGELQKADGRYRQVSLYDFKSL